MAAAQAAVTAAKAAAAAAAVAAAASIIQSSIATLTDIFGIGTIPASIASIISAASIAASDAASVINDAWQTKPPQSNPVPPDADPARNPNINSGGGANTPAAGCFRAGSSGQITILGGLIWLATGTTKEPATITDAGSNAYFALQLPNGVFSAQALCSGVYAWSSGAQASFQVSCSTNELGTYWNGVKQTCYTVQVTGGYALVCGNNVGSIYSCLQSNGVNGQISPASFTWST
ncbi:hypothetical protein B0H10DRAFT_2316888 [Mycena sp. CBHHK59/15]|nr:hypothetical protein B0H10DRAFT_2316888 [Mycena sp. CBHHK59/15]